MIFTAGVKVLHFICRFSLVARRLRYLFISAAAAGAVYSSPY